MQTLVLSKKYFNIQNNLVEWEIPYNKSLYKLLKYNNKEIFIENGNIKLETDLNSFTTFFNTYKNVVFIEDDLDLSISISQEFDSEKERKMIGKMWYEIKYKAEYSNIDFLSDVLIYTIRNLPIYNNSENVICAVPISTDNVSEYNFIDVILKNTSKELKITMSELKWLNKKEKVKYLKYEQKVNALKNSSLLIKGDLINKDCILFDDLYQSGATINYVASKLKEQGAKNVYGITLIKNPNNFDNNEFNKNRLS
jgi:hypothetical protein